MPIISVVIPAYNRAKTIKPSIESALNQLLDVEVLVVDDGSTDDTKGIVLGIEDERVKLISQPNGGANRARNTGIDAARGEYIAFLDSDDLFLSNHLQSSIEVLSRKKIDVVYSKIIVDRGDGKTFIKPPRALGANEDMSEYLLCGRGFLQTSTLVLKTEIARQVKFSPSLPFGQDTDFAIRLYNFGCSFHMKDAPYVLWADHFDPLRVSSHLSSQDRLKWLQDNRNIITTKALNADKGWFVAKALVQEGSYLRGLSYYVIAILKRSYSFKHSLIVGAQVFFPKVLYRRAADFYIKHCH